MRVKKWQAKKTSYKSKYRPFTVNCKNGSTDTKKNGTRILYMINIIKFINNIVEYQ